MDEKKAIVEIIQEIERDELKDYLEGFIGFGLLFMLVFTLAIFTGQGVGTMKRDICGECKYHEKCTWQQPQEWFCNNSKSEYFTHFTDYKDSCADFEEAEK